MEDIIMKTQRFRQSILIITFWMLIALVMQPVVTFAAEGKLVYDKIHSPALEGNLLGDSADRSIIVYLPPGYDENPDVCYPVIYLLHGTTITNSVWTDGFFQGFNIKTAMDTLVAEGKIEEMILVMPDAKNKYGGCFYANSDTTGNWEDFITQDLVKYIGSTYRTLPQTESRGIAGHSMGGAGALKLAMKNPNVYSAVYGLSSGPMKFEIGFIINEKDTWISTLNLKEMDQFSTAKDWTKTQIALSVAFSPNPNRPPFFADFPFELVGGELKRVESVWQRWLAHDAVAMVSSHQAELLQLRAIRLDCGTSDGLIGQSRAFSQALTDAGIPHVFEEYPGDHLSGVRQRMETKVLPFFSDVLAFEMLLKTDVQPRGKLTTTWGEMKRGR